jgi:hypothetical protein
MKTGIIGFINNSNTRIYNEVKKLQSLLVERYSSNFIPSEVIYTKILDLGGTHKMCREIRLIYDKIKNLVGSKCTFSETYFDGNKIMCKYTVSDYAVTINVGEFNNIVKVNKFILHDFFIEDVQVIEIGHSGEIKIIKKSINNMVSL